jgi:hypothetical protein
VRLARQQQLQQGQQQLLQVQRLQRQMWLVQQKQALVLALLQGLGQRVM